MKTNRKIQAVTGHSRIDGVVPGVKGQRAFPIQTLPSFDPFVMLDHIGPQKVGIDYSMKGIAHPHRGFETITFMLGGNMHHMDSLGNKTLLESGSVQRMNAGSGIQHGGNMHSDGQSGRFHETQLWVNLPAAKKMSTPNIHNVTEKEIPVIQQGQASVRIIGGDLMGQKGPIETIAKTQLAHIIGDGEAIVNLSSIPLNYNAMLHVLEGEIKVQGQKIEADQSVIFDNAGKSIELTTGANSQVLFISGIPLNEPVAMGGPFVMNTSEEIQQAYADFNAGKFGKVLQ